MIFLDLISISFGNLWRMKLRSFLTISGVIIGIAALVSMMSFGAGMQKNVADKFKSLELFNTLQVLPNFPAERGEYYDNIDPDDQPRLKTKPAKSDTLPKKSLDESAIEEIGKIPGVKSVYPEDTFPVRLKFRDKSTSTTAQSLPASVADLSAFKEMIAGHFFQSDTSREVVLNYHILEKLGVEKPDSIIGREVSIITARINIPGAIFRLTGSGRASPFVEAEYKFTVCGVMNMEMGIGINFRNLIIPYQTAKSIERLSFNTPFELLSQLSGEGKQEYPSLTVRVKSSEHFESAKDSIEALGYNTFSFADQFEEIKKVFVVFDMVLGVVGFIALVVASLGIINTMVMSIIERYREIGILKSLGADNRDIRWLFLVESSSIGFIGSLLGLLFGWIITRIGSAVAKYFMVKQGAPSIEMFHLPIWLIILALVFGTTVSLLAGMYPASRASRIDPVQALRHD